MSTAFGDLDCVETSGCFGEAGGGGKDPRGPGCTSTRRKQGGEHSERRQLFLNLCWEEKQEGNLSPGVGVGSEVVCLCF